MQYFTDYNRAMRVLGNYRCAECHKPLMVTRARATDYKVTCSSGEHDASEFIKASAITVKLEPTVLPQTTEEILALLGYRG